MNNFQVDLGGLVELLSRNLYSGPRVFVRELLQNGVDAISARREADPGCPRTISVTISAEETGRILRVTDTGRGLTFDEAGNLLATIGASSKRDELGFQRGEYLGQFGIGLLSALMVSPHIVVYSRSVDALDQPIRWEGRASGTWTVRKAEAHELPAELVGPGTTVELVQQDFDFSRVPELVEYYGSYLPVDINIDGFSSPRTTPPWLATESEREQWCQSHFGFTPFTAIDLTDDVAGARGVAFVIPAGAHPGHSVRHTVYLQSMLLSDTVVDLVPDWAYFVRVVVDVSNLRPTASREALIDDDLLEETRQHFGEQIRSWLRDLADSDPERFAQFAGLHFVGLKSLAVVDAETRALVARAVPVPTTLGPLTYDEIFAQHGSLHYVRTTKDFEAIEALAKAKQFCVVSAGYAFEEEILNELRLDRPHSRIELFSPDTLLSTLAQPTPTEHAALQALLDAAQASLAGQNIDIELRKYEPADLPAVYVPQPDAASDTIESQIAEVDPLVALMNPQTQRRRPCLVFNANSQTLHQLSGTSSSDVLPVALRGLYLQALIAANRPLDQQARAWSNNLFTALINRIN